MNGTGDEESAENVDCVDIEQQNLQAQQMYIIDFGLAKFYIDEYTGFHNQCRQKSHYVGTASFSSVNSHLLFE